MSAKPRPAEEVLVELQIIFGENLRAARLRYGLTQDEMAELTGLRRQYLSVIERGEQNIRLKTVALLAAVLDYEPDAMLRRTQRVPKKK